MKALIKMQPESTSGGNTVGTRKWAAKQNFNRTNRRSAGEP
jgi:hypothetical protein